MFRPTDGRERLIERAAQEFFTDGCVALDTAVALMGEGVEIEAIHDELRFEIESAL